MISSLLDRDRCRTEAVGADRHIAAALHLICPGETVRR